MRATVLLVLVVFFVPPFARADQACCEFCPDQHEQKGQYPYFEVIRTQRQLTDVDIVAGEG